MSYRETIFVYSDIPKTKSTISAKCNIFNIVPGGTFSNRWTLEG